MADITAQKPVSGAPIESGWGAEIHDAIEGIQYGRNSVVFAAASDANLVITFPRAYASTPAVIVSLDAGVTRALVGKATAVGTSGFTFQGQHTSGGTASGSVNFSWIAIGTPA